MYRWHMHHSFITKCCQLILRRKSDYFSKSQMWLYWYGAKHINKRVLELNKHIRLKNDSHHVNRNMKTGENSNEMKKSNFTYKQSSDYTADTCHTLAIHVSVLVCGGLTPSVNIWKVTSLVHVNFSEPPHLQLFTHMTICQKSFGRKCMLSRANAQQQTLFFFFVYFCRHSHWKIKSFAFDSAPSSSNKHEQQPERFPQWLAVTWKWPSCSLGWTPPLQCLTKGLWVS